MSKKTRQVIDDYVMTLLTESATEQQSNELEQEQQAAAAANESATNLAPKPAAKTQNIETETADRSTPTEAQEPNNLVRFPQQAAKHKAVEDTKPEPEQCNGELNVSNQEDDAAIDDSDIEKAILETLNEQQLSSQEPVKTQQVQPQSTTQNSVAPREFKEKPKPKVNLTSHLQLSAAQKLLQAYELRQQQQLKTQQQIKVRQQTTTLVKQAVANKLSLQQQQKLLNVLKQQNLTQEMEIVEAVIAARLKEQVQTEQRVAVEQKQAIEQKQAVEHKTEQKQASESKTEQAEQTMTQAARQNQPWAQGEFQCLIFHIGSLKVAVPLSKLGGIHTLEKKLTPIFGKPPWYMGITQHLKDNIHVVDTAFWVSPSNHEKIKADYTHYIILGDSDWGIACSQIGEAVRLTSKDIKWASENSKKSWFAGMLVGEMCALLDIDNFIKELSEFHGN